jgi:two-component sensor histidine kinase
MPGPEQTHDVARFPLVPPNAAGPAGLVTVVRRLSIARSLEEIMEVVTNAARTLLHADGITFVLREGDLCHYAEEDAISPLWKGNRFPMSACISGWCMVEGKAAVIPDIYQDERIPHDAYRPTFVRSLAMVPVRQDDPIAAVGAYWSTRRETTAAEVDLLQAIANAAGLAIAQVELRSEERVARTSPQSEAPATPEGPAGNVGQWSKAAAPGSDGLLSRRQLLPASMARWLDEIRPGSAAAYAFAVGCVAVATAVRFVLAAWFGEGVVAFATYFPAVLVAALVGGASAGALALMLGGVVGWWAFMPPYYSLRLISPAQAVSLVVYAVSSALVVLAAESYRRVVAALREEQSRRTLMLNELQHRMRNTLAVVQAIVTHSLRGAPEQAHTIAGRIAALMATNELLGQSQSQTADLRSIFSSELAPYGEARVSVEGASVRLMPDLARALALIVHELATNAAKHGALSVPDGRVRVSWSALGTRVNILWAESDGPTVAAPVRRGFGTSFIARVLRSVDGAVESEFNPAGVRCTITFALPSP